LVLEVGADRPGDIRSVAKWLPLQVAVITRLPEIPVHVEFFESPEALVEEKAALIEALQPRGTLVVYGDDERARSLSARAQARDANVMTFGLSEHAQVRASGAALLPQAAGMQAQLEFEGKRLPIELRGVVGEHQLLPLVAAAAVGVRVGKSVPAIVEGLKSYVPPPGRMHLIEGIKGTLIIDDTYNSSPAACAAALDALKLFAPRRLITVMGDMLELGRHSAQEHRKVGAQAAGIAHLLVTVGFRARDVAQGALDAGMPDASILQYEDAAAAGNELQTLVREGDVILVKGSQSMRMERVVEEIMKEPEHAGELLVRQEDEWKKR
jgi:UDP-N-acetylmuramoyl-tripeptide--D-alanyl-D-alanine ligase